MPSVGFDGALGQQAMAEQIRQRLMDELNKTKTLHGMGVEDQRLALEKQRFEQEAADRALLRSQQGTAFNETLAEKTAANLTPQSIISPELATRFKNTSLAPLISPDQTLPSTSTAGASALPGADAPPAVPPAVTQNAPTLTGQLRYAGTPAQVKTSADEAAISQLARDPKTSPAIRGFLQMRQALPKGENIPYQLITEPNGRSQPLEQVATPTGPKYVPRNQAVGATPYHVPPPPQLAIVQTTNDQGQNVTKIVPKVAGSEFTGKQDAATVASERASKEALGTFDQLDQAIDAAKDLIGPGEGRVSSVEQMIGNPDPRINELGVMIKATKMRADHAITGSVRAAASPTLIKQWDDLLANKLTPESLHGTVRALRAVVQGPGGGSTSAHKKYNPATGKLE